MKTSEKLEKFIAHHEAANVRTVSIEFLKDRLPEVRRLEDRVSRNRGYATFYRDKGLSIMRHDRKLDAVVEDAKELRIQMLAMKKEFLSSNPTRQEKIMAGVFSKWINELDALAELSEEKDG